MGKRAGEILPHAPGILMGQGWNVAPDERLRPGVVRLAWEPEALWVRAELNDDEICSRATSDSQHLWELGDVFEMFLQGEGRDDYAEMHVSPGGFRMQLALDGTKFRRLESDECRVEDFLVVPPRFDAEARQETGGWTVEARIPAGEVDPKGRIDAGDRWLGSFCRYDVGCEGRPVLSSTSLHRVCRFHRRQEWRTICF